MAIDALVAPLLKIALFQGLKPLQITEIVRRSERIVFRPGQTIVEIGTQAHAAYVLVHGNAARTKGPDIDGQPESLVIGSLVGEMAMLVDTEYSSTVIAETTVRALRISRAAMYEQMADDAALAEHLVAKITARLKILAGELRAIDRCFDGTERTADVPMAWVVTQVRAFEHVRPGLETRH